VEGKRVRGAITGFFSGLRDLWIAIGITLLAFALLEWAYVGQLAVRERMRGSDEVRAAREPGHPYAGQEWYPEFLAARDATREKYDAWRGYWAYPTASRYLNVDSAGYRLTVQPAGAQSATRTVFLLGGSAMWGFTARDSMTIPSLVASGLRAAGFGDVAVINMAQPGYTIGHELATLTRELSRRGPPDVAVFFDGINDIRTTQLAGEPGHAFFEGRFGRLYEVEAQRGMFGSLLTAGERSRLVGRIGQALGVSDPWKTIPQTPETCPRLGRYFRDVHRHAAGLAQSWDFDLLIAQQPNHAATRKALTTFERSFIGPEWHVTFTRDCADAIDSAMSDVAGHSFVSYTRMFDADTASVFIDRYGHVSEVANRRLADALVTEISARLTRRAARTP